MKGHIIGIVENVQDTSSIMVCITEPLLCYMNGECVLESRDTPTAGNNLIPISILIYSPFPQASNQLTETVQIHDIV